MHLVRNRLTVKMRSRESGNGERKTSLNGVESFAIPAGPINKPNAQSFRDITLRYVRKNQQQKRIHVFVLLGVCFLCFCIFFSC